MGPGGVPADPVGREREGEALANYLFSTMTAAEARNFTSADTVTFDAATGFESSVSYVPATGSDPELVAITQGGRTLSFPSLYLAHATWQAASGSELLIGSNLDGDNGATGAGNDGLFGGGGADTLSGGGGNNLLQGNQGADSLVGGAGSDSIYGGQDGDYITLGSSSAGDRSNFGQGNKGADTVVGGIDADTLLGGQDNDSINAGGGGNDFLNGNLGDDFINGGSGGDRIFGEDGADSMNGGGGSDTLNGGAGDDALDGGSGADALTGGDGSDSFLFSAATSNVSVTDNILDWTSADKLRFAFASGFRAATATTYAETTATSAAEAISNANAIINAGTVDFVAVQVGADVVVFADSSNNNGDADSAVIIVGKLISDIAYTNIV
jgi:Ca2+-binding RTX toxin-like protein